MAIKPHALDARIVLHFQWSTTLRVPFEATRSTGSKEDNALKIVVPIGLKISSIVLYLKIVSPANVAVYLNTTTQYPM